MVVTLPPSSFDYSPGLVSLLQACLATTTSMPKANPLQHPRYESFRLVSGLYLSNLEMVNLYILMILIMTGDQSVLETAANVATSLPFIVLGMQAPR